MRIIISRTDSIGDVVLTLPVAAALKKEIPGCTVIFLGRRYTRPVLELCANIDEIAVWDDLAFSGHKTKGYAKEFFESLRADVILHVFPVKEICIAAKNAKIPLRIATAGRTFTWFTCNKLLRIPRKNSGLHESQLNLKMLKGLKIRDVYELAEIGSMYGIGHEKRDTPTGNRQYLRVILHPKSKGSAREWGLDNFSRLIDLLPSEKYEILISGTREEGALMGDFMERHKNRVTDLTGKLTLEELIQLISDCGVLVAASTGPLHIAAALGIRAIGLYAPMRPIFPQRWAPVGVHASFLVMEKPCSDCRKTMDCHCIREITPESVFGEINRVRPGGNHE